MKEFPLPLLILAFLCLAPVLWGMSFYLFGAVQPFGTSQVALVRPLLYLAAQLLWVVPVAMFFVSLNEYRRGYNIRAYCYAIFGVALGAFSLAELFL
ncbi:MAG: hypothetical protein MJZ40_02080 [Bacteroidaceae bacterium]|nr:hypothetical protein [Bacteroidaceae bacterium]